MGLPILPQRVTRRAAALLVLPVLLPAVFYLAQLNRFGRLEYDDYYGIVPQVVQGTHFTSDPWRWLTVKSNEHSVVLPALVFALNIAVTGGDNRVLSALAVALLGCVAVLLWRVLPSAFSRSGALRWAGPLFVGGLVLSPAGSYSVVMGFSGVIWFTSVALSVAAIVTLRRGAASRSPWPVIAIVAAGWAAGLSYGAGLFLWPALVAGALMVRAPRRRVLALCVGGLAAFVFALATYARPAGHPEVGLASLRLLVEFAAVYLGSFFVANPLAAGVLGLAGLAAAAVLGFRLFRGLGAETADELAPWVMLGAFGVLNAAGTAVARASMGGARSSRYAPVAGLFWMALLVIATALASRARRRQRPAGSVVGLTPSLVLLLFLAATWWRGIPILAGWVERAAWQGPAELALVDGIEDLEALEALSVAPREVLARRELLIRLRHVPFDRPQAGALVPAGRPPHAAAPCAGLAATVTALSPVDGETVRVEGVIEGGGSPSPELAVVDGDGRTRGALRVLPPSPLRARDGEPAGRVLRWAGYARSARREDPLRIAVLSTDGIGPPCTASEPWRISDGSTGASSVGAWKQPLGLRRSPP